MIVIFQTCKSQVLESVTSVVSRDNVSELVEPIHPHLLISGSGPDVALPGNASSIFCDVATILV